LSEAAVHTVVLRRGRGTCVQDVVLTFRQMLSGWPSYEKGTATTCYLISTLFQKFMLWLAFWCCAIAALKQHIRIRCSDADVLYIFVEFVSYLARSTISVRRQCFPLESGRVSARRTVSPIPAVFSSSCALTRLVRLMILPYRACCLKYSISTTMVFSILSDTTTPRRVLR